MEACRLDLFDTVSKSSTLKGKSPSDILSKEITKATGIEHPPGWQAHHIVAEGSNNVDAVEAREILKQYDIEFNSSSNGVFLPKEAGSGATIVIDGQTIATHNGGHTKTYYQSVRDRLALADRDGGEVAVLTELKKIREDLLTGLETIGKVK